MVRFEFCAVPRSRERGFTLIEVLAFIVVLGLVLVTSLKVMSHNSRQSMDPIIRFMALEKGQALLEQVYASDFDQLKNYHAFQEKHDAYYQLEVSVKNAGQDLDLPMQEAQLITVTVKTPDLAPLSLSGYRVRY